MNILNDFFSSEQLPDEAMDYLEMHGFLTSLSIQPMALDSQQVINQISPEASLPEAIQNEISTLKKTIQQSLLNGDFPDIPSIEEDEDTLTLWSSGFMQGVFAQEKEWFESHPEEVAELTLPILSCSGLLEDELSEISQNEELLDELAAKIPDCVIDLYLLFNTPEGP